MVRKPEKGKKEDYIRKRARAILDSEGYEDANDFVYKTETVTPAQALVWLRKNPYNRAVSKRYVRQLARDMLNGKYKFTHEAIAIDKDGNLADGQHRLEAIVLAWKESGETFPGVMMKVAYGVDKCSMDVINSGKIRHFKDHMKIRGGSLRSAHGSTASILLGPGLGNGESASTQELLDFIEKHREAIDYAVDLKVNPAVVRAVLARAAEALPNERHLISRFAEGYKTGRSAGEEEWAAVVLREYIRERHKFGTSDRIRFYVATENALIAFMRGKPITKVRINEEHIEKFPYRGETPRVFKVAKSQQEEFVGARPTWNK